MALCRCAFIIIYFSYYNQSPCTNKNLRSLKLIHQSSETEYSYHSMVDNATNLASILLRFKKAPRDAGSSPASRQPLVLDLYRQSRHWDCPNVWVRSITILLHYEQLLSIFISLYFWVAGACLFQACFYIMDLSKITTYTTKTSVLRCHCLAIALYQAILNFFHLQKLKTREGLGSKVK